MNIACATAGVALYKNYNSYEMWDTEVRTLVRPYLFYSLSDNSSDSISSDNTGVISLTGLSPGT